MPDIGMGSLKLLLVALGVWLLSSTSMAQPTQAGSQDLDYDGAVAAGLQAYKDGRFSGARELFQRAHTLNPNARTLRALGLTAVELKLYTAARAELAAALADARQPLTAEQREEVAGMLAWLKSAFAIVHVKVAPSQAQVAIDGAATSDDAVLEAGSHELRVTAAGYEPFAQSFQAAMGEERTLELALKRIHVRPEPAPLTAAGPARADARALAGDQHPHDSGSGTVLSRWWFWTAVGVAVVAGGTVAAVALTAKRAPTEEPGIVIGVLRSGP